MTHAGAAPPVRAASGCRWSIEQAAADPTFEANGHAVVDAIRHHVGMAAENRWTVDHFSQSNPKGPGQDDVPALLRRVAETLETYGRIHVQDLVLHTEVNEHGDWHSVTVYFTRPSIRAAPVNSD